MCAVWECLTERGFREFVWDQPSRGGDGPVK